MKHITLIFALAAFIAVLATRSVYPGEEDTAPAADKKAEVPAKVAILKIDDLICAKEWWCPNGKRPGATNLIDYCEKRGIKSSFGVIGNGIEEANPIFCDWIKELHKSGMVEFWNHGYGIPDNSEFTGTYEKQRDSLKKTQDVAMRKFGFAFAAFGPHNSWHNEDTIKALKEIPEIKVMFYMRDELIKDASVMSLPRTNIELSGTFQVSFDEFKKSFDQRKGASPVVLQLHLWNFDEKDPAKNKNFAELEKTIDFLLEDGWTFMTPSEYYAAMTKDE